MNSPNFTSLFDPINKLQTYMLPELIRNFTEQSYVAENSTFQRRISCAIPLYETSEAFLPNKSYQRHS
jgi:hypothetical protein